MLTFLWKNAAGILLVIICSIFIAGGVMAAEKFDIRVNDTLIAREVPVKNPLKFIPRGINFELNSREWSGQLELIPAGDQKDNSIAAGLKKIIYSSFKNPHYGQVIWQKPVDWTRVSGDSIGLNLKAEGEAKRRLRWVDVSVNGETIIYRKKFKNNLKTEIDLKQQFSSEQEFLDRLQANNYVLKVKIKFFDQFGNSVVLPVRQLVVTENYLAKLREGNIAGAKKSDSSETKDKTATVNKRIALGDSTAPLKLNWFFNYKSDYSRSFWNNVFPRLYKDFIEKGKLYFTAHYLPADNSRSDVKAGKAATCAIDFNAFWPYHNQLMNNEISPDNSRYIEFATNNDIDSGEFGRCIERNFSSEVIKNNINISQAKGIKGVPTFFLGKRNFTGKRIQGFYSASWFRKQILDRLN